MNELTINTIILNLITLSVIFAQQPQNMQKHLNNVNIEDHCSQDVVFIIDFISLLSNDHLSVNEYVEPKEDDHEEAIEHVHGFVPEDEGEDQEHEDSTGDQSKCTSQNCEVSLCSPGIDCQPSNNSSCHEGCSKDNDWVIHWWDEGYHISFTKGEDTQTNVILGHSSGYFLIAEDYQLNNDSSEAEDGH